MSKPLVISIIGTRPEAIKMAPVIRLLDADGEIDHKLVVTAQHRHLLDDVLSLFRLSAAHDLDLMVDRQSLGHITSRALSGLIDVLRDEQPGLVLVHGDTTTTFTAALAAFYLHIPVGHVEAGLRTSTVKAPFPEELNRRITDLIADHYYCPTQGAAENLETGEHDGRIFITGNTALDAVRLMHQPDYRFTGGELADFAAHSGPKLLLTAHRRDNWGEPLCAICGALIDALDAAPDARALVCWHPNPAVRETMLPLLGDHPRVSLVDPPRFDAFVNLVAHSDLILSDSGGIQEEVTLLDKYVLVLRGETERPEAVQAGYARVVGTRRDAIYDALMETLPLCISGKLPAGTASPFGDGYAADRIHSAIRWVVGLGDAPPADYTAS